MKAISKRYFCSMNKYLNVALLASVSANCYFTIQCYLYFSQFSQKNSRNYWDILYAWRNLYLKGRLLFSLKSQNSSDTVSWQDFSVRLPSKMLHRFERTIRSSHYHIPRLTVCKWRGIRLFTVQKEDKTGFLTFGQIANEVKHFKVAELRSNQL